MSDEATARIETAALLAELSHRGDAGDIPGLARLFAESGLYKLQDGSKATGPSAIEKMLNDFSNRLSALGSAAPSYMRHHATTSRIDVTGSHEARGDTYFLNVNEEDVDHWGRWRDTYTLREAGRWRFTSREVVVEGKADTSWLNELR